MDTQTTALYFTFITGVAFLTLLLILFIYWIIRHQKERLAEYRMQVTREIELIDKERGRINADLHDKLGSGLATVVLLLQQVQYPADPALKKAGKQLQLQREKIKEISHDLVPPILEQQGLSVALADLFEDIRSAGKVKLRTKMELEDNRFLPAKSVHVYRIVREILTNTLKHAWASQISINGEQDEKYVILLIRDNGTGFDTEQPAKARHMLGLQNIQARVSLLNASVFLESKPGIGTAYRIKIPVQSMTMADGN
jgi:signal transduction histidine kinase